MTTLTISIIVVFVLGYALTATRKLDKGKPRQLIAPLMLVRLLDPLRWIQCSISSWCTLIIQAVLLEWWKRWPESSREHLGDTTTLFFLMARTHHVPTATVGGGVAGGWVGGWNGGPTARDAANLKSAAPRAALGLTFFPLLSPSGCLHPIFTQLVMTRSSFLRHRPQGISYLCLPRQQCCHPGSSHNRLTMPHHRSGTRDWLRGIADLIRLFTGYRFAPSNMLANLPMFPLFDQNVIGCWFQLLAVHCPDLWTFHLAPTSR